MINWCSESEKSKTS